MEKVRHLWTQGRLARGEWSCLTYDTPSAGGWRVGVSQRNGYDRETKKGNILIVIQTYSVMCSYIHMVIKTALTELVNIFLTLVKKHPGKKYSTMVIDATITKNNTHTTMVRAEGRKHDL